MTDAQPITPVVKPLNLALYHAGLEHSRAAPQIDLSPLAFLADDFYLRFSLFPRGVDLYPQWRGIEFVKRSAQIVLPDGVTPFDLSPKRLIVP